MRHLLILFTLFSFSLSAQPSVENISLSDQAYQALTQNDYRRAIKLYRKVFKQEQSTTLDVMRAAAAAQGANRVEMRSDLLKHAFLTDPLEAVKVYELYPEFKGLRESNFSRQIYALMDQAFPSDILWAKSGKSTYISKDPDYRYFVSLGRELMRAGDFKMAYSYLSRASKITTQSRILLVRQAACAAVVGELEVAKNLLSKAFLLAPLKTLNLIKYGREFKPIHYDQNFQVILNDLIESYFPNFDPRVAAELDEIWEDFIRYRQTQYETSPSINHYDAYHVFLIDTTLQKQQAVLDQICLKRLRNLLDSVGYPSVELVAERYDLPIRVFMIAKPTDWEKYMDIFIAEATREEMQDLRLNYCLAEHYDHALALSGQKQVYGTVGYNIPEENHDQWVMRIWPVINKDEIEQRRAALGLDELTFRGIEAPLEKIKQEANIPPIEVMLYITLSRHFWNQGRE